MDIGDITDPNLDGDFKALLEARKVRVSPRLCCRYAANIHTYHYWYSITPSLFHSRLKTFLYCKSFLQ